MLTKKLFRIIYRHEKANIGLQDYIPIPYTNNSFSFMGSGILCGHVIWCLLRQLYLRFHNDQLLVHWREGYGSLSLSKWNYIENQWLCWTGSHQWREWSPNDPRFNLYSLCTMHLSCSHKWVDVNFFAVNPIWYSIPKYNTWNSPSHDCIEVTRDLRNCSIPLTPRCNGRIAIIFGLRASWTTFLRLSIDKFSILNLFL